MVPIARAHARADRAHARGGGGRVRLPGAGGGSEPVSAHTLERLRALLREEGGLIASLIREAGSEDGAAPDADESAPSPATLAAEGPRARGRREEYELLVEAIYEGYLLHYGT